MTSPRKKVEFAEVGTELVAVATTAKAQRIHKNFVKENMVKRTVLFDCRKGKRGEIER
jgi:hypothetical protein